MRALDSRRTLALLTLAGVTLAAANGWLFLHRAEGYAFAVERYATIYWPVEAPAIAGFIRTATGFEARFAPGADPRWTPGGSAEPLRAGVGVEEHALRFGPEPGAPELEVLSLVPPDPNAMVFAANELLYADAPRFPLRDLVADPEDYPPADLARVREHLATLGLDAAQTAEQRLAKIWIALHDELEPHRGPPPPGLERLPAYEQYRRALAGEAKLYCANFAAILTLFATAAGIPARIVDSAGERDGVQLGAHAFVEVFLPELQRWAFTDLTNRVFLVRAGESGPPLNSVQIAEAQRAGTTALLVAIRPQGGALVPQPFDSARQARLSIQPESTFVFHRHYGERHTALARLARYLFAPEPAYRLDGSAAPHRVKLAVFWATALVTVAWVFNALALLRDRR